MDFLKKKCNIMLFLLLCVVLVLFTSMSSLEGFTLNTLEGSDLNYNMGQGVNVSWENKKIENDLGNRLNTVNGGVVPSDNELYMFSKNKISPNCSSPYSSSTGNVCLSKEQTNFLNQRGGNRTLTSEY